MIDFKIICITSANVNDFLDSNYIKAVIDIFFSRICKKTGKPTNIFLLKVELLDTPIDFSISSETCKNIYFSFWFVLKP